MQFLIVPALQVYVGSRFEINHPFRELEYFKLLISFENRSVLTVDLLRSKYHVVGLKEMITFQKSLVVTRSFHHLNGAFLRGATRKNRELGRDSR